MANVKIRHLSKDTTWHTANATWVPELGRIVVLTGANPLLFKIGDGTTQLQNLEWSNGTKTLAQVLLAGNMTGGTKIQSDNGRSQLKVNDTESSLTHYNGSQGGGITNNTTETRLEHSNHIHLDALAVFLEQGSMKGANAKANLDLIAASASLTFQDGSVVSGNTNTISKSELAYYNGVVYAYLRNEAAQSSIVNPTNIEFTSASVTKNGYELATQNYVGQLLQSNIKIIGDWDASSGSYPLADESNTTPFITQWGATIKAGWAFRVGYGQPGTVDGYDYENGDVVYALVDSPTNDSADWGDLDHNLQQATESLRGTAKIVTIAIMEDETTLDDEKIVTPYKFWAKAIPRFKLLAHTWDLLQSFTNGIRSSVYDSSTGEFKFTKTIAGAVLLWTNGQNMRFSATVGGSPNMEIDASTGKVKLPSETASTPVKLDSNKGLTSGAFGDGAGEFCEGNDVRFGYPVKLNFSATGFSNNTSYYLHNFPSIVAATSSASRFRHKALMSGIIDTINLVGNFTSGTAENHILRIKNVTTNTTVTITTTLLFNAVFNNQYTGIGLSVTKGDEIALWVETPATGTRASAVTLNADILIGSAT